MEGSSGPTLAARAAALGLDIRGCHPEVADFFVKIAESAREHPELVGKIRGVFQFRIAGDSEWAVDLKHGAGSVVRGVAPKADTTIEYSSARVMLDINTGRVGVKRALLMGQFKLGGDLKLLGRMQQTLDEAKKQEEAEARRRRAEKEAAEHRARLPSYVEEEGGGSKGGGPTSPRSSPTSADGASRRWSFFAPGAGDSGASPPPPTNILARTFSGSAGRPAVSGSGSRWMSDSEATNCLQCQKPFNFFTRRHHCRLCGRIFCDACAPKRSNDQRECGDCHAGLRARPGSATRPSMSLGGPGAVGAAGRPADLASAMIRGAAASALAAIPVPAPTRKLAEPRNILARSDGSSAGTPVSGAGAITPGNNGVSRDAAAGGGGAQNTAPTGSPVGEEYALAAPSPLEDEDLLRGVGGGVGDGEGSVVGGNGGGAGAGGSGGVSGGSAAAERALGDRIHQLEEEIEALKTELVAHSQPESHSPSWAMVLANNDVVAAVLFPLLWAAALLGWRAVPVFLGGWAFLSYLFGDGVWWNLLWFLAAAGLWYVGTAEGYELLRRRLKVFGVTAIVMLDYKIVGAVAKAMDEEERAALWEIVHRRNAARILRIIRDLRGLWVKLGQYLSTRADVMPDGYIRVLAKLQDGMPAEPLSEVRATISEQLGRSVDEVFASIDEKALASASIAQVHRAVLRDGTVVAIKVQHRGMGRILEHDLVNLGYALSFMSWFEPGFDLRQVVEEWSREVGKELDFKNEARNTTLVRDNLRAGGMPVTVPRVIPELVGTRVLVMRFVEGIKVSMPLRQLDELGVDRDKLVADVCRAYAHQIYVNGLFNGDPHPGNIMLIQRSKLRDGDPNDPDVKRAKELLRAAGDGGAAGVVATNLAAQGTPNYNVAIGHDSDWVPVLLDFGLTKQLPDAMRLAFARMVVSAEEVDYNGVLEAFEDMGMRFSRESAAEDMENLQHMFRDAVPAHEARRRQEERTKAKETERAKKGDKPDDRKVEAWPSELMFFLRTSELLQGLCSQLETRHPFMQTMARAARQAFLLRCPAERRFLPDRPVRPLPPPSQRLRVSAGGRAAVRGVDDAALRDGGRTRRFVAEGGSGGGGGAGGAGGGGAGGASGAFPPSSPTSSSSSSSSLAGAAGFSKLERLVVAALERLYEGGAVLGMQVAVFVENVCVVDAAVGPMGALDLRPVESNSLFPVFGVSRLASAAVVQCLSDAGLLRPADRVSKFWPEFGAAGKTGCTISELLRCRSGVEGFLPTPMTTASFSREQWGASTAAVAAASPLLLRCLVPAFQQHLARQEERARLASRASRASSIHSRRLTQRSHSRHYSLADGLDGTAVDLATASDDEHGEGGGGSGGGGSKALATGRSGESEANADPDANADADAASELASDDPEDWTSIMPSGPRPPFEQSTHLYFGWGWAAGGLVEHASGASFAEAIETHLTKPLRIEGEFCLGVDESRDATMVDRITTVSLDAEATVDLSALTSSGPAGGWGSGESVASGSVGRPSLARSTMQRSILNGSPTPSLAPSSGRLPATPGPSSPATSAAGAAAASGSAAAAAASTAPGSAAASALSESAPDADAEDDAANSNTMSALLAAMEFHEVLTRGGLGDLAALGSGGLEHFVDPRLVNARKVRGACVPSTNLYASARALACVGTSLCERLSASLAAEGHDGAALWNVRPSADGHARITPPVPRGRGATPSAAEEGPAFLANAVVVEACRSLGFRPVLFQLGDSAAGRPRAASSSGTHPEWAGLPDPRESAPATAFGMGGLGGTLLVVDVMRKVSFAITVNKIVPNRSPALALATLLCEELALGRPINL